MVTKQKQYGFEVLDSSVLAKIFMVTKQCPESHCSHIRSVLAKIFMVTKPFHTSHRTGIRSVLAKIFMVTKPQKYGSTFLNVIEY